MNKLHNKIALRYKQSVIIENSTGKIPAIYTRGLMLDISQLGYTLDVETIRALRTLTETEFKDFHKMLVTNLKEMVGANVKYTALFKNFPEDIPNDEEYLVKRVIGFITNMYDIVPDDIAALSCGHVIDTRLFNIDEFGVCPICQHQVDELHDDESDRPALKDLTPLKIISLKEKYTITKLFSNLIASKTSISKEDHQVIIDLVEQDALMLVYIPDLIPLKENKAIIISLCIKFMDNPTAILSKHIKTATDVLRLAVQLNGGDVSLKENTKIKLNNKMRRLIMQLLDNVNRPEEDMLRYRMRWIRLAEVLHIGKYKGKYPNAAAACDKLRNDEKTIETFNKKVERSILSITDGDKVAEKALIDLLATRPGEFARRMDYMLREFSDGILVINMFKGIICDMPTPMLMTLSSHFKYRSINGESRYFMPKGSMAKMQVIEDNRKVIDQKFINVITKSISNELVTRFSTLDTLGKVYINPELKNYLVPMVKRNTSKSLVTIARGSHVPLMENKIVRMFLYWKENSDVGRVDVDLSAILYSDDWEYKEHVSYTQLTAIGGKHSGDITSAPNGASEFIDIDVDTARGNGIRYVVMTLISYNGQNYSDFECFAGIMGRDSVGSGKKFEAKTVKNKFDLSGECKYNIPIIFDLVKNEMIWCDIALTSPARNRVGKDSNIVVDMAKSVESMIDDKPNMFDLLLHHANARGESVTTEREEGEKYDTEFDVDMASDIDDILANWL